MNELTIFKNDNFGEIRTVIINEEPWFVLKDICQILGIENHKHLSKRLDNDEVGSFDLPHPQSPHKTVNMRCVNESGVYSVVLRSDKSEAKLFKRWLTHDVIPQIRKSGMYIMAPKTYSDALRALANEVEEKELIKKQRDEAILTKTWISDKKTATAMNTASQKAKEVNRLKMELSRSKEFASVKAVEKITKEKFNWRAIRDYCTAHELEMGSTFDANYGSVRAYPAEAWMRVYNIDLKELFADVTKSGDCYD